MTKKIKIAFLICISLFACKNRYFLKGAGDTYLKGRNSPTIDGYHIFHNNIVSTGTPQPWNVSKNYNKVQVPDTMVSFMQKTETAAFLIIKNDPAGTRVIPCSFYWRSS